MVLSLTIILKRSMGIFTQDRRPFRVYTPLDYDVLLLEDLKGEEEISAPFDFQLSMISENDSISPEDLIRKPAHVEIDLLDGSKRYIHGVVSDFVQLGRRQVFTAYQAKLRPWFWFLSLWKDCRIFQKMSVPDIVEQVFTERGFHDFTLRLFGSYAQREYCVQYRESSFDFVSRLLEEEGIFYYFEHTADKHVLILTDDKAGYVVCPGQKTARIVPEAVPSLDDDVVDGIDRYVRAGTGQVTLNDYDFKKPSQSLKVNVAGVDSEEIYDYPGEYEDRGDGDRYAGIRLEEKETPEIIITGTSTCRPFTAGYKFDLKEHYRRDLNITYLLTKVNLSMKTSSYQSGPEFRTDYINKFEAIPTDLTFRPARRTPRPRISGVQTALVVGPQGEEIYSDSYGRVKVQFYWDRLGKKDQNSSCWIRVSQEWAGKNWGAVYIPRIGQEVIVDFLEGDPDRPIITGRVYNAEQMPPYTLPDNQTQSGVKSRSSKGGGSSNFNEFRLEDLKGSELVFLHAEKDLTTEVEHDETRTVQHDRTTTITNDETKTITQGNESITLNQGNQSTSVELGKIEIEAMQSIKLTVGQNSILIDQTGVTIDALMIKLQGQILVQIQAPIIQITADGILQLQGGLTTIN
jgi:type VI secretion system secreted protein VgrG